MKYSLTKCWRRQVSDIKCSLKDTNLKIIGEPIEDQWQACET
jgi:hypothetical protein